MAARRTLCLGLVLLAAGGVLQSQAQAPVPVQPKFQQDKFLGRWFTAGLASNSSWFREKKAVMTMCLSEVAPTAEGGFNITTTFLRKNQCETRSLLLQPAGSPGSYSYISPHWGSTYLTWVVETDYQEFALLYSEGTKGPGQDFRMATLYSRSQTPKEELREKFSTFCQAQGFPEEAMIFLPRNDKCLKEQD